MFLKHFVYVNWGNIPNIEFEFGPINLFSGGNGSGKTTAADAIQTVMTAAHENLFQFNPGQDETTQRGRGGKRVRTLASYILGCDDGSFARLDPTDGYVAAVFHPTRGESGEPFTAVIGVRAWLDRAGSNRVARQEDAQFFIASGCELGLHHFVREAATTKYVVPLPELHTLLIGEFGKRRVEKYETKKAYLRRLYAALRGKSDAVSEAEAMAAARAFSRFMAYKPVKEINRFVADEILEQKDLGEAIRSVSSQLKTIHNMERDAAQLVESITILTAANSHVQTYIDQWVELNLLDYTLAQAEFQARQRDYLRGKQQQREQRQAQSDKQRSVEEMQVRVEQIREQLIGIEARRQGVDALRQKDELEQERATLDKRLVEQARGLLQQDQRVSGNLQATADIVRALSDGPESVLPVQAGLHNESLSRAVLDSGKHVIQDIHSLVQQDIAQQLPPLEAELDTIRALQSHHNQWRAHWFDQITPGNGDDDDGCPRDRLASAVQSGRNRYQSLGEQRKQKRQEIDRLSANQVTYPGYVVRALKAIRQQCPEADPRVLCDHVEVKDPRWQSAIEGYLGNARFSILVEPDCEARAMRIVRALPGSDNRARVIQGDKAQRDAARLAGGLAPDSIVHVLEFTHAVAQAYVSASYGTVVRVPSAEQLRSTRRGVTEDGMGSGNYSMFRCDITDAELVFGARARSRALAAKREELQRIDIEWNQANDRLQQLAALLRNVDSLHECHYADALAGILATHRDIFRVHQLLEQLDLSEHRDLEARMKQLKEEQKQLSQRETELNREIGEISETLKSTDKKIAALSQQQERNRESVETRQEALAAIAAVWPDFAMDARLDAADREAHDLNIEHSQQYRQQLDGSLRLTERKTAEKILQHNQHCRAADTIAYEAFNGDYDAALFRAMCELQREVDRVYNVLKNNILVHKHQQLNELKETFNSAFVTHLCHAIYQAINDAKRQIEQLNKELQHHRFGADRETFRFASEWVPEYRDYARFFEEVVRNPVLGDGVALFEAELSAKSKKVLNELMQKLLDEDEHSAMRDLQRIGDYRNYRRYEIYKEVEGKDPIPLSEYGTGSGGQLETPAYIIRSAAVTSAFRFAEGNSHLRMVLVDEAFSKMDETRSREVIDYLTGSLGLQLLFIMPTSKCGPFMELISNEFVFAKVPSEKTRGQLNTRVLVDRKQCNREKITALWANHRRNVYHQAELDFMEEFVEG